MNSGFDKEGTKWTYRQEDQTLIISGRGKMEHYPDEKSAPWFDYAKLIKHVEIDEGVTGIGDNAFAGCVNLETAALPNGLKRLGESAFSWCKRLRHIALAGDAASVGKYAAVWRKSPCTAAGRTSVRTHSATVQVWSASGFRRVCTVSALPRSTAAAV